MDTCFACHSLRTPLTDGIDPHSPFLDQFTPNMITSPLYFADGQIKEEVYVYGSFLQSKMYQAGVMCQDCHDPHSMQLKALGNGTCLQCHSPSEYNVPTHHGHSISGEGGQCVNCHMPDTVYMGVDNRRDHSFKIPRPSVSEAFNTPNAASDCHDDKTHSWADAAIKKWHPEPKPLAKNQQHAIAINAGKQVSISDHLAVINDGTLPDMVRASALVNLPESTPHLPDTLISLWANAPEPLLRLALAQRGNLMNEQVRATSYSLLSDNLKAVRLAATNYLIDTPNVDNALLRKVLDSLIDANMLNQWRGEGNLNQSLLHMSLNQASQAETALKHSIEVDPFFAESYVNLADIYRIQKRAKDEASLYKIALDKVPDEPSFTTATGYFLFANKTKTRL